VVKGFRHDERMQEYDIHYISFKRKKDDGYTVLQLSKEKPQSWHIEKMREFIAAHDNVIEEEDYSDLC